MNFPLYLELKKVGLPGAPDITSRQQYRHSREHWLQHSNTATLYYYVCELSMQNSTTHTTCCTTSMRTTCPVSAFWPCKDDVFCSYCGPINIVQHFVIAKLSVMNKGKKRLSNILHMDGWRSGTSSWRFCATIADLSTNYAGMMLWEGNTVIILPNGRVCPQTAFPTTTSDKVSNILAPLAYYKGFVYTCGGSCECSSSSPPAAVIKQAQFISSWNNSISSPWSQ